MISFLEGIVLNKDHRSLTLNVHGVGYRLAVPLPLLEEAEEHLPLTLHVHTHVREDELSLYGFQNRDDLLLFELFISVSGVGPRLALDLFTHPIKEVKRAILENNPGFLTQIPGIGKKTAERIVLELKEKIARFGGDNDYASLATHSSNIPHEVSDALQSLGYRPKDIQRVFRRLNEMEPLENSEAMIKYFLKHV